ncbi:helix-turn-helix domain-containing protein [Streptomyces xiamenensis]|uniref:helix-turn-helix domain-containing protein n=1 Tax=Streptomyces xiamenensis TaxID=408015 RepID=UPI0006288367|nr:helix-turn-helix transcriptional regulator [Streptomyces xiamenensis]
MSSAPRGVQEARQELGGRLRALRQAAAVDGRTLAERLGWPPSKVSKIQLGRQSPTEGDIREWTAACGEPQAAEELLILLRNLDRRYADWRRQLRQGHAAVQRAWADAEATAQTIRSFESSCVPGLLQTADYAASVLRQHGRLHGSPPDTDSAVAARLARQQVLYEPGRKRRFLLLSESALFHSTASAPVMRAQIDRLVSATTLPTLSLGVIPQRKQQLLLPAHGFCILDDRLVTVEIYSAELRLGLPEEVALYQRVFEMLSADALYGADARRLLTTAAESWV